MLIGKSIHVAEKRDCYLFLTVAVQDLCDPEKNPAGHIALCVAENKLVLDIIAERFMQSAAAFSDSSVYCYNSFLGMPIAREAVAYFLARRFLFPEQVHLDPHAALTHIKPTHVALGSGCAALINHLFFLLGEPGDACLIPAPYYAAFENDMNLIAGVIPCRIEQANPRAGPTEAELETAYFEVCAKGLTPKFVLLTNPNNPLGTIYKPEVIRRTVDWARERQMQTIVDEIYALSTLKKEGHGFQSVIKVLDNKLGDDVHFLWALSKDFAASGLRVGVVYSQNEMLLEGLATCSIFTAVSGPIQYLVSELLTDDVFVDHYLDESRRRLNLNYIICAKKLQEMVLPYEAAEAGLFVYVDFSSLLPEKTVEYERELGDLMFKYARLVLTPGESQRDSRPGMFRICYAWNDPVVMEIAMERLSRLVAKVRRLDWSDLGDRALGSILE